MWAWEMTPEKFEGIARAHAPDAEKAVYASCPDQFVGTLSAVYDARVFCQRDVIGPTPQMRVILVMESPHTAEFEKGMPFGPANGPTGVNIRRLLQRVLEKVRPVSENSELVLMNAVQYQCSLGELPKIHRDAVFQKVWSEGAKEDFRERLQDVFRQGDVVINACTRGKTTPPLRDMVKDVIDEVVGEHWRTAHPSSWMLPARTVAVSQPRIEARDFTDHLS
jgi:hypothetical protein